MHRLLRPLLACLLAALLLPAAAARADTPKPGALYETGPTGRYLLAGTWQFRSGAKGPWKPVTVPNAWNATDTSMRSFVGGVGWYRKDFTLPSSSRGLAWIVRFESVSYRARVSLNGHVIGTHQGAYLPFEMVLPPTLLHRHGPNRLLVRVDDRLRVTDFPPGRAGADGDPTGGWWNYGGLLREVYLRKVDRLDLEDVQVLPELACRSCAATVRFRLRVRNLSAHPQRATVAATYGTRHLTLGSATLDPGEARTLQRSLVIRHPSLWEPGHPHLYPVEIDARAGGATVQRYRLHSGIRSLRVSKTGEVLLNGRVLSARGMALHEDSPDRGAAIDDATRDRTLDLIQDVGATMIRSHYPLHPHTYEEADRRGIVVWSEIPVYSVPVAELAHRSERDAAVALLRRNVVTNANHPSIAVWSIGNELGSNPGPAQGSYIADAARAAHQLDPTRLVGLAFAGYPSVGCQTEYAPLDVLGTNIYFGWYPGPGGQIADRTLLPGYLAMLHRCYPHQGIFVTEYGAEANRDGPAEEKGTYAFQQQWVRDVIGVFDRTPWLAGAIYWTIQEFRVRPTWTGENPYPTPPLHQKGLVTFHGRKKPAYFDVRRLYRAHRQLR